MDKITSDIHLYHKNILKYETKYRPWNSVDDMNDFLIEQIRFNLRDCERFFFLGDFSFGSKSKTESILFHLDGSNNYLRKMVFVKGNHDKGIVGLLAKYNVKVVDYYETKVGEKKIVMSHYPMVSWNCSNYGSVMLHGHCHGDLNKENENFNRHDVGWDANGKILTLDEAVDKAYKGKGVNHHGAKT